MGNGITGLLISMLLPLGGREEKGEDEKGVKMCYLHTATPQKECSHYVLQTSTNKTF